MQQPNSTYHEQAFRTESPESPQTSLRAMENLDESSVRAALAAYAPTERTATPGAATIVSLLSTGESFDLLFEVRAQHLKRQPGEVCLPGGRREQGEHPEETAIREMCEELQLAEQQVELLSWLGDYRGPGDRPIAVYAAIVHDYQQTYDPAEVDHVFTVPLSWFFANRPTTYSFDPASAFADDFPWELIPGGRAYPFKGSARDVTFYLGSSPLIWGFTANVIKATVRIIEEFNKASEANRV